MFGFWPFHCAGDCTSMMTNFKETRKGRSTLQDQLSRMSSRIQNAIIWFADTKGAENWEDEMNRLSLKRCTGKPSLESHTSSYSSSYTAKQSLHSFSASLCVCSARCDSNLAKETCISMEAILAREPLSGTDTGAHSMRYFAYKEIAEATGNFHPENIVGKGGYSDVYRGTLLNGQVIAVKKLIQQGDKNQREKEFLAEIGIMGHIHHPNTTSLIGCCLEGGLCLVFHFYPHGSLANLLHGNKNQVLDWSTRYKVALGTARGLHYLHKSCQRRIIHRDITSSNILLGSDFEPQISDFGLAKWLPKQWTHHSVTPIEGTFGYLAPEYFMHGIVDEKTDVFAFGVLLLEIISGRRPVDESRQTLALWASPLLEAEQIQGLADPNLRGSYDLRQMQSLVRIAAVCIRQSSISRPTMNQVLELFI